MSVGAFVPSGLKERLKTDPACFTGGLRGRPDARSQNLASPLSDPDKSVRPSGLTANLPLNLPFAPVSKDEKAGSVA